MAKLNEALNEPANGSFSRKKRRRERSSLGERASLLPLPVERVPMQTIDRSIKSTPRRIMNQKTLIVRNERAGIHPRSGAERQAHARARARVPLWIPWIGVRGVARGERSAPIDLMKRKEAIVPRGEKRTSRRSISLSFSPPRSMGPPRVSNGERRGTPSELPGERANL